MKQILLPEIVALGIYNAQLTFKNKEATPNRKTTMFEIELPIGNGGTSYMDGTSCAITENIVICAKPGQLRHTHLPFRCYYIHMIVNEGELFNSLSSLPNYIEMRDTSEIRKIFVDLCECHENGIPEQEILIQSLVLKLVYLLKRQESQQIAAYMPKSSNREAIERTISYIRENPTADLCLNTLSKKVKFSPIYFHKVFKASTGKTLREYVEEQRMKKAIDMLISTNMTLTQIAYECGFSSQSYFSFAFKKKMNQTPREYVRTLLLKYEKTD